jgi:TonB family protein
VKILYRESDGTPVLPDAGEELGAGGQARVVGVAGNPAWAVKRYHHPAEQQARKLRVMLANPPLASTDGASPAPRQALVWPADLLRDEEGRTVGLLMRRVSGMQRAFELYNPATRRLRSPHFHYARLHRAARNVAAAFAALHAAGYVVGDANESNVLVDEEGNVTVIDTDSFQVRDPATGEVFRCPVGRPEFAPPELQGRTLSEVDRTPEHDRFALGVLVFQLLMEGTHPFAGRYPGPGEPPPIPDRIARGLFPYTPGGEMKPPRNAPPLELLHPLLRGAMRRCFEVGHADPSARPHAHEWAAALQAAEAALVQCAANPAHHHGRHLAACPWCQRKRALGGRDPFPTAAAVARGEHLKAPPRRRGPAAMGAPAGRTRFAAIGATGQLATSGTTRYWTGGLVAVSLMSMLWSWPTALVLMLAVACFGYALVGIKKSDPVALGLVVLSLVLAMVGVTRGAFASADGAYTTFDHVRPAVETDPAHVRDDGGTYETSDLTRQPLPLMPDSLPAIASALWSRGMERNDTPAMTWVRFEVGADGAVDSATVSFSVPGMEGTDQAARMLARIPFRPAEVDGQPVRVRTELPLLWVHGRATALPRRAGWADLAFLRANPGFAGDRNPSPAPELSEVDRRPLLSNAPVLLRNVEREYPPELLAAGQGGFVLLRLLVERDGRVNPSSVRVDSGSDLRFVPAAARALDSLRFQPAMLHGEPTPVWVKLPVEFEVNDQPSAARNIVVTQRHHGGTYVVEPGAGGRVIRIDTGTGMTSNPPY